MQIVLHAGAHFAEEVRLMKCLLRNRGEFATYGVSVPGPGKYRALLRQTLFAMSDTAPAENARDMVLDEILDGERTERVLLSHTHIFGAPRASVRRGLLYPNAPLRMSQLAQLFHRDDIELFFAIRNPAAFLPAAFEQSPKQNIWSFLGCSDPGTIRWSETFERIREAAPEVPITAWCAEDSPMIWSHVIRDMAGTDHGHKIIGGFDLLSEIITQAGMARFRNYLRRRPDMSEMQVRQVIAAFLERFAIDEATEEEIDLPGWTEDLIERLTEIYDEDLHAIRRIPGVQLITP